MSVIRQFDYLGQMRWDIPFAKSIESSICSDFDLLAGRILSGNQSLVVRGFEITAAASAVGKNAVDLQLNTANSALIHPMATESGSIFFVPSSATLFNFTPNDQLRGSFTASSVNYVGLDLIRSTSSPAATATTDTVKFLDPGTTAEITRQVPLGKILDYVIVISTVSFDNTPSILPLCKITTNGSNVVTAIQDCRYRPSRLAVGGSFPAVQSSYPWPQGREENTTGDVFYGGDKAINSYKEWQDAIMSRVWEIGGGKYWYSPTADRNIRMTRGGTTFSDGEWFEWDGTNLHWRGLKMVFDNSNAGVYFNTITDQLVNAVGAYGTTATNLADGDCIYVDLTRNSNGTIVALKAQISTLGTPITPGSRYILAWRVGSVVYTRDSGFPVGATFTVASTTALGIVKLSHTPTTPLAPIVLSDGALNAALGVVGLDANKRAIITATAGNSLTLTGAAATSASLVTNEAAITNVKPQIMYKDTGGNMRAGVDHNGFPTGPYSELREEWVWPFGTNTTADTTTLFASYPLWAYRIHLGSISSFQNFGVGVNFNTVKITTDAGAGSHYSSVAFNTATTSGGPYAFTDPSDLTWKMAFPVSLSAFTTNYCVGTGSGSNNIHLGLDLDAVYFRKLTTDVNWKAVCHQGATATVVDTGVLPVAGAYNFMQIEFYGSSTANTRKCKFYIDGVLVATTADPGVTLIPASQQMPEFTAFDAGGLANSLYIGPVHIVWSQKLSIGEL